MVTDTIGLAASKDVMYGCLVPGGVAASKGFDCGGNLSLRGYFVSRSTGSSLCGEVEYKARATVLDAFVNTRAGRSKALSMKSFLENLSAVRGVVREGARVSFQHNSPTGSNRVITPFSCGGLIG